MAIGNEMAILQEVDKCVRCNGCVISCKRTWQMKGDTSRDVPHNNLAPNQRLVIKSQKQVDNGPFVRFSCWHCQDAPCTKRCPKDAIHKNTDTGAVWIDPTKCRPAECGHQCKIDCQRGGVPMIGQGSDNFGARAWKCTLCTGSYTGAPYVGAGLGGDLPTKNPVNSAGKCYSALPTSDLVNKPEVKELEHQPSCVFTCPAKAMVYDTRANIIKYLSDTGQSWTSKFGDGSMFWASKKFLVAPPKADPFIEDHVAPLFAGVLSSPLAKAAVAPTLVAGAVLAVMARRAKMENETSVVGGER